MPGDVFLLPFRPGLTANAIPIVGARLEFYASGTSTPQAVFADEALTVPLGAVVIANSAGVWPSIYMDATKIYRVVMRDQDGEVLREVDPYVASVVDNLAPEIAQDAAEAKQSSAIAQNAALALVLYSGGYVGINNAVPPVDVASGEAYLYTLGARMFLALNDDGAPDNQIEFSTTASLEGQIADASATNAEVGKIPRFRDLVGYPTLDVDDRLLFFHGEGKTSPNDEFSVRIDRRADYTGGDLGFLNSALKINSFVTGQGAAFESALTVIQNNYANAGETLDDVPQHHPAAFQGNKFGNAPIWGIVVEANDKTGIADPATGQVGIELDMQGTGTDAQRNRIGMAIISRRSGELFTWGGDPCTVGYGLLLTKETSDSADNKFDIGISFGRPGAPTAFQVGIDFSNASPAIAAIRLGGDQNISWVGDNSRLMRYDTGAKALRYFTVDGAVFDQKDTGDYSITGNYQILGNQVLTSRRTGWSGPVGTATRTGFNTAEVTTQQLAERLKALLDDLLAHGLIGS